MFILDIQPSSTPSKNYSFLQERVYSAPSRQPGGCGLSWSGITVIKKDNVIVFQVVIWPVQL
ncbi:hypothetical protein, partial [Escherichia coli]|uniref:hypothetical protein n=1 Tax=Escherichia coli TaxID=562 RepID=UPI003218D102